MPTYLTKPPVPVQALRLNEDIQSLRAAGRILRTVDAYNVTDDPDKDELWLIIGKLTIMERHAADKLRREYLAPIRRKIERRQPRNV